MAISAINDWLRARGDYHRGVELLKLHGTPSAALLTVLAMPESAFTRAKLDAALRQVNAAAVAPEPKLPASASRSAVPVISPDDDVDDRVHKRMLAPRVQDIPMEMLPKELRPVRQQLLQQFREYTFTRGSMRNVPDGMHLRRIAERVVELRRQMRMGWWLIEHWRKTGVVVRAAEDATVLNPVELRRQERKLSTWISQRKPDAPKPRKCTPAQMEKAKTELARIRELLKSNAVPA